MLEMGMQSKQAFQFLHYFFKFVDSYSTVKDNFRRLILALCRNIVVIPLAELRITHKI
jgi:hypothetical protein